MTLRRGLAFVSIKGPPGNRRYRAQFANGHRTGGGYTSSLDAIRAALRPQVPQQQQDHSSARRRVSKADGGTGGDFPPATEHPRPHSEAGDGLGEVVVESELEWGRRVHAPGPALLQWKGGRGAEGQ